MELVQSSTEAETGRAPSRLDVLLRRLERAARGIHNLRHLEEIIEQLEVLQQDYAERSQLEANIQETLELLQKARQPAVIKQLAFYFSDANLRHDVFLRDRIGEEASGHLPLELLLPFKRLRTIGCTTAEEIAEAVKAAPPEAALELSADSKAVRRLAGKALPPLVDVAAAAAPSSRDPRTVHIANFERGDESVTEQAITDLCTSYGAVANVWLVRESSESAPEASARPAEFLGTVEVEFRSKDGALAAIAADPQPTWRGAALRLRAMADVRERRTEGQPTSKRARIEEEASAAAARFERGLVLRVSEIPEGLHWKALKSQFDALGEVVYVDHEVDDDACHVRMRDAEGVRAVLDALERCGGRLPMGEATEAPQLTDEVEIQPQQADSSKEKTCPVDAEAVMPVSDPYGGEALAQSGVSRTEAGEPFVIDTQGNAASTSAAPSIAAVTVKAVGVLIARLSGDEEEQYIQKMALALAEKRERQRGKDGKCKGGRGDKGGKLGKGKSGKECRKGKKCKSKKGKHKNAPSFDSDES